MTKDNLDLISGILDELNFEKALYEEIANHEPYEVVPIESGVTFPGSKEDISRQALQVHCNRSGKKILYRISYGNYAVIMSEDNDKIGLEPEEEGWYC